MTDGTVYSGSHWQRYATSDTEEAHAYIRRAFFDVKVRLSGESRDGVGLRTITTSLADVGVTRLHYSARTQVQTAPDGDLNITHLLRGRFTIARNKDEYHLRPGDVALMLPDQPEEAEFDDVDSFTARLPRALLEEVAHAQTGISGTDLRFDSSRPISAAFGRHWTRTVSHLTRSTRSPIRGATRRGAVRPTSRKPSSTCGRCSSPARNSAAWPPTSTAESAVHRHALVNRSSQPDPRPA